MNELFFFLRCNSDDRGGGGKKRKGKEDRNESLKAGKKRSIFIEGTWDFELAYRSSQSNSSLLVAEQEHIWETDVSSFNFLVYNYPSF